MSQFKLQTEILGTGWTEKQPEKERPITLDRAINWISEKTTIEDAVKKELIKELKGYPQGSLRHYCNNLKHHVLRTRTRIYGNRAAAAPAQEDKPEGPKLPPMPEQWD